MSKAKYQLLPKSDQTPAMEVNLSIATSTNLQPVQQASHDASVLTEVNLNDNQTSPTNNEPVITVNLIPVVPSPSSVQPTVPQTPPASELPSYNEALRLKKLEGEVPPSYYSSVNGFNEARTITIDTADLRAIAEASDSPLNDQDIGSECMFLSAFMIAFFFNWIGFFASICLLPNAAGKYGALSGFGLSMAKWVTIVRYQEWMTTMTDFQQKVFFWLFIFLGFYLFFRGLINYMSLKYRPRSIPDYSRRTRNRWYWLIE